MNQTHTMQIHNGQITLNVTTKVVEHYKTKLPTYIINFYDDRYQHTQHGQFISGYFLETLQESRTGILLDSGSDDWFINKPEVDKVLEWTKKLPAPTF